MPILRSLDDPTRTSVLATILCVAASILGLVLIRAVEAFTSLGHLPIGIFLGTLLTALTAYWLSRHGRKAFDLSTTFVTYLLTMLSSAWILRFFFVDPAVGPFADPFWTIPNGLANVVFGFFFFALMGMTLGMTYFAARRTHDSVSLRRGVIAIVGIAAPIYLLARTEYFLTQFQI